MISDWFPETYSPKKFNLFELPGDQRESSANMQKTIRVYGIKHSLVRTTIETKVGARTHRCLVGSVLAILTGKLFGGKLSPRIIRIYSNALLHHFRDRVLVFLGRLQDFCIWSSTRANSALQMVSAASKSTCYDDNCFIINRVWGFFILFEISFYLKQ